MNDAAGLRWTSITRSHQNVSAETYINDNFIYAL
jgi:hypothetical protein